MLRMKWKMACCAGAMLACGPVLAQSSVTLYGIVDDSIMYSSSQASLGSTHGGKSNVQILAGSWAGSRFGLRGEEDLGGGYKAIFQLENGFNENSGAALQGGALFGRLAFVGIASTSYGKLTFGRQYTPYFTLLSPYGPTRWLGMHPGDVDALDYIYHTNNSVVYTSPNLHGLTFGVMYALAGIAGSVNQGSTWSGAVQYDMGPIGVGVGFWRINNATAGGGAFSASSTTYSGSQTGVSALTNGYQTAQAQQRFAVTGVYRFNDAWDLSLSYSNVQYIPGVNSLFLDTATFNTEGAVLHWKFSPVWDFATGYSYTRATKSNGISNPASYNQFHLAEYYSLSKRTGLYGFQAWQRANGQTLGTGGAGNLIDATATIGDYFQSTPSSSRSQLAVAIGIIHRF